MLGIIITILIAFFATNLFGYVVHWSLHQKWAGSINKAHMTHHLVLYPPDNYSSIDYRHAGKDSSPKFFAIASIPMVAMPIILGLLSILPWHLVIIALVVEGSLGALHNYIHDCTHIKKHWLLKIPLVRPIFRNLMKKHFQHHSDMTKNYGIFIFHWDRVFGTYKK